MRNKFLYFQSSVITVLMGLLGFTACSESPAEYGTPSADYKVLGVAIDTQTKTPVKNIRAVIVAVRGEIENPYLTDTVYTDANGKFELNHEYFPVAEITYRLKLDDIDGEKNGGDFAPHKQDVVFVKKDLQGGSDWYEGKAIKNVGNIELAPFAKEETENK